jgi:hypothetical protein
MIKSHSEKEGIIRSKQKGCWEKEKEAIIGGEELVVCA